jgi:Sulfotransferase domain
MPEVLHRLPHFIIAGAPRSGTSWLSALARRHPQIAMADPVVPEPKFFLVDELWQRGIGYYSAKWFASLPVGRVLGEKSTNYLESPEAAERIHQTMPGIKLVFLLREPVSRAYSNYRWSRRNGLETESFERALALEEQRERDLASNLRYARPHAYFSRGLYAEHLSRFFNRFAREQILILRYEDVATCPERTAVAFQCFVGVNEMPELARDLGPINSSEPGSPEQIPDVLRRELSARYREANARLGTLLGVNFEIWNCH